MFFIEQIYDFITDRARLRTVAPAIWASIVTWVSTNRGWNPNEVIIEIASWVGVELSEQTATLAAVTVLVYVLYSIFKALEARAPNMGLFLIRRGLPFYAKEVDKSIIKAKFTSPDHDPVVFVEKDRIPKPRYTDVIDDFLKKHQG